MGLLKQETQDGSSCCLLRHRLKQLWLTLRPGSRRLPVAHCRKSTSSVLNSSMVIVFGLAPSTVGYARNETAPGVRSRRAI